MLTLRHRSTVGAVLENVALERDRALIEATNPVPSARRYGRSIVWLFAASLFLSSLLMFAIEPIVARTVLPILGGTPMVWNTCVLFFQILLLAGYGYAHGVTRWLGPRGVGAAYGVVLLLPFLTLPFSLGGDARPPDGNPIGWLLLVLAQSIGLPFFALAATAPVLQRWFADTDHPSAADPYFLYAASNLGSLLALVMYPVLVEPMLRLRMQTQFWTIGYAGFVVAAGLAVAAGWRRRVPEHRELTKSAEVVTAPLTWQRRVTWIVLAFIPSSLMLGVTTYFSTDIAPVPLLWIAPLALYLLTFVVAFGTRSGPSTDSARSAASPPIVERLIPFVILPIAVMTMGENRLPLGVAILLHLGAFTMAALLCHRRLSADRPETIHLTEFYFWIAFGGMLGGVFNTLAAPLLFSRIIEYPLVLVLALAARRGNPAHAGSSWSIKDVAIPIGIGTLTAGLLVCLNDGPYGKWVFIAGLGPLWAAVHSQSRIPVRFAASIAAMLVAGSFAVHRDNLYVSRTFFGVYRVARHATGAYHALIHGTTWHGMQAIDPAHQGESLTYFHRQGPIGQAFEALPPSATQRPVAVVGLGVGSLAAYRQPGQPWTFYEIDPEVERIARTDKYFTYLRACGDDCRVVLGDARLSLERVPQQTYGLMILDAFSSDAIPIHLMTRDAVGLYLSRLAPGGVLAFHISNRHLNLTPVLARIAASYGLEVRQQRHRADPAAAPVLLSSWWLVMARNTSDLGPVASDPRWTMPAIPPSTPLWTDDFSNIISVLSLAD